MRGFVVYVGNHLTSGECVAMLGVKGNDMNKYHIRQIDNLGRQDTTHEMHDPSNGLKAFLALAEEGSYPRGGSIVLVEINKETLVERPLVMCNRDLFQVLNRGAITITGTIFAYNTPKVKFTL